MCVCVCVCVCVCMCVCVCLCERERERERERENFKMGGAECCGNILTANYIGANCSLLFICLFVRLWLENDNSKFGPTNQNE